MIECATGQLQNTYGENPVFLLQQIFLMNI